jgi:hypothetical protein
MREDYPGTMTNSEPKGDPKGVWILVWWLGPILAVIVLAALLRG